MTDDATGQAEKRRGCCGWCDWWWWWFWINDSVLLYYYKNEGGAGEPCLWSRSDFIEYRVIYLILSY